MVCESWKEKVDTYLDGELSQEETRTLDAHLRSCSACSAETLARVQMKRAVQAAGKRFIPSAEFRKRIEQSTRRNKRPAFRFEWAFAAAAAVILLGGLVTLNYARARSAREHVFSEIADLHVETLASSSPVDVISTDRHTVKPWFQGRIPFAFNLPELQNSEFSLVGGRMTYLDQAPGAHLIYDVRKHHISVFIFTEDSVRAPLKDQSVLPAKLPFNLETWDQGGLRYFVVGDASASDIDSLAKLFKAE